MDFVEGRTLGEVTGDRLITPRSSAASENARVHRQRLASCLTYIPRLVKVIDHDNQPIAAAGMRSDGGQLATVGAGTNLLIHNLEFESVVRRVPLDGLLIALNCNPMGKSILVSLLQEGGSSVLVDGLTGEIFTHRFGDSIVAQCTLFENVAWTAVVLWPSQINLSERTQGIDDSSSLCSL